MGVFVLGRQISADLRQTLLTSPWTWAAVATAAGIAFSWYVLRRSGRTPEQTGDAPDVSDDASGPTVPLTVRAETVLSNGTGASPRDA